MKFVVSSSFGVFKLPQEYAEAHHKHIYDDINRQNPSLVDFVEQNPDKAKGLRITLVPDEATDYQINDYDGKEAIIYVLDGKIYWA